MQFIIRFRKLSFIGIVIYICFFIVYGGFRVLAVEVKSCYRDYLVYKVKEFIIGFLIEKVR